MDEDDGFEEDTEQFEQTEKGELSESQKQNIAAIYKRFDLDGDGVLTGKELRKGLQFLGLNPTRDDIKRIKKEHNLNAKKISYEEFEQVMKEEVLSKADPQFDLLEAFRIFDKDKSGRLNKRELAYALRTLGEQLSEEEVDDLFKTLDTNKDGELDYIEASKLLA